MMTDILILTQFIYITSLTTRIEFPGDLRNGTFQGLWDKWSDKTKLNKRSVELNNGRAAMMGILGLMVHEQLGTNMPIIGQL